MRRHLKFILSVTRRHWRSIGRRLEWSALLLRRDYWSKWIQLSLSTSLELTEAALGGRLCGTISGQERGGRSSWRWPHFLQHCSFAWGLMVSRWKSLGPNLGQLGSRRSQPPFCSISEEVAVCAPLAGLWNKLTADLAARIPPLTIRREVSCKCFVSLPNICFNREQLFLFLIY